MKLLKQFVKTKKEEISLKKIIGLLVCVGIGAPILELNMYALNDDLSVITSNGMEEG